MKSDNTYSPKPDSFPARVIAYFRRVPDEEMSVEDLALKFDIERSGIHTNLKPAVEHDMLKRDGSIYSAGKNIGTAEPGTKLADLPRRKSATAGLTSPRLALDLALLKVEEGVPCPAGNKLGISKWDDLFTKLAKAGQSIAVPADVKGALAAEANKRNKKKLGTFRVHKTSATQARIWRTA